MSRPWMPLYIADYLADTAHLSTVEHGAYLLLIMHYWMHRKLPQDEKRLARIARLSDAEWESIAPALLDLFGSDWTHARIDREIADADEKYQKRADAGKKGGSSRKTSNDEAMLKPGLSIAEARLNQPQPQPPSPTEKDNTGGTRDTREPVPLDTLSNALFEAAGKAADPTSPSLMVMSDALGWIAQGCDLQADILPAIRATAIRAPPGRIRSWAYFGSAVTEARDRRLQPHPVRTQIHRGKTNAGSAFDAVFEDIRSELAAAGGSG